MKDISIECNTKGEVNIDDNARKNGISVVLVDEKRTPVANYEFNSRKLSNMTRLLYYANNIRIHFYGDITPTMIFELTSDNS